MKDYFVNISLKDEVPDLYLVRSAIRDFLVNEKVNLRGRFLDFGCGEMPYKKMLCENSEIKEYIGLDLDVATAHRKNKPDLTWDGKTIPLADNTIDCAMATEVFEHCADPELVMEEICRVLKPSGFLIFTVPFLWPLHEVPYDEYRYTPFSLERHLKQSGFSSVNISALGGWNASMAQMLGLWLRRAPMPERRRKLMKFILMPFYRYLIKRNFPVRKFGESTMVIGLCGKAVK
ncbi:MAG: class I SAM-dependent methyltransferase [Bacteroidetes bacterium]|jgi:SAM-dependent methyltransferase|nr:class I SAM-dependent methyltransferase [Bacteroidota bacterium]